MGITLTSLKLKSELRRRRDAFTRVLSAVLAVPPDLFWVYMQEHGTATRGDTPGPAYDIYPVNAKALSWQGKDGRRVFMDWVKDHPGVPARHFIAESIDEICRTVLATVVEAMLASDYNYEQVKDAFMSVGMEKVKEIVTNAIEQKLNVDGVRDDGKLKGQVAAEVFNQNAYIKDRSGEE